MTILGFFNRTWLLSGSRKKHSTETAVVYLTDYILEHIDRQMITEAVFIDLKKAFDLGDRECLLFKLEHYTESDEVVWTGSWSTLRHELKKCNLEMTCPHILYINDLPQCLENYSINKYGHDTVMYFTNLCTSEIARVVHDLNRVLQWMESSRLILNQSNTKSILFRSWKNLTCQITKFLYTVIRKEFS